MSRGFLTGITFVFRCDCSSRGVDTMNVPAPHNEKQTTTIASFNIRLAANYGLSLEFTRNAALNGGESKAINPSAVSVGPAGLDCITAHQVEPDELEALVGVAHIRTHNLPEHIRLPAASRARTRAPQQFEFSETADTHQRRSLLDRHHKIAAHPHR